jgi:hypothetical protein
MREFLQGRACTMCAQAERTESDDVGVKLRDDHSIGGGACRQLSNRCLQALHKARNTRWRLNHSATISVVI